MARLSFKTGTTTRSLEWANKVLIVDTSVIIDLSKGKQTKEVVFLIEYENQGGAIAVPSICYSEILQGARTLAEWKKIRSVLGVNEILFPKNTVKFWEDASRIYFDLRRKGKTISSLIDCLVAQIVLDFKGILLHHDRDYELIKTIRPLKTKCYF